MPAGDDQRQQGKRRWLLPSALGLQTLVCQPQRIEVPFQVVHGAQGPPAPQRQPLGELNPHQQRADQPRPLGDGDRVQFRQGAAGLCQCLTADRRDRFQLRPRRQLRVDAAIGRVQVHLRGHHLRAHPAAIRDDRGRRLVAGSFDAEDEGHGVSLALFYPCSSVVWIFVDVSMVRREIYRAFACDIFRKALGGFPPDNRQVHH